MTGIYLLFIAALWLVFVIWFSKTVTKKLPMDTWRVPGTIVVFAAMLPLPLLDEIIGGRQFEQLCKDNAEIQVDRMTAIGKTVYYVPEPGIQIKNMWLRAVLQSYRYVDATTGNFVIGYSTLTASGGRLIQALGVSEGGMPLTFAGTCGPVINPKDLFKQLAITALDRPKQTSKVADMTTSINDTYVNALLADASYVSSLNLANTPDSLTTALTGRMTPEQAKYIGDNFTVAYSASTALDAQGNAYRQVGSHTTTLDVTRAADDAWFQVANNASWGIAA